jgi:hypothetical protein
MRLEWSRFSAKSFLIGESTLNGHGESIALFIPASDPSTRLELRIPVTQSDPARKDDLDALRRAPWQVKLGWSLAQSTASLGVGHP